MDGHGRLQLDALPALLGPRTRLVALGHAAAVDYLNAIGRERIVRHERELVGYALERVREIAEVRVYGPPHRRAIGRARPIQPGGDSPCEALFPSLAAQSRPRPALAERW